MKYLLFVALFLFFYLSGFATVHAQSAGVYYGAYTENLSDLSSFESLAGKKVSLFMIYQSWNEGGFPNGQMESIRSHGAIPVVSWDSYIPERPVDTSWKSIAAGSMDSYINQWADDAKNWGHPLFLRFDWEMNGYWIPYSDQADSFVPMWKHVHDIFTQKQVHNVTWVWCPNVDSVSTRPLEPMYPGSDYVDWVCLDGYNFGNTQSWSTWQSFSSIYTPTYNHLGRLAPGKPIMIAELSSAEQGGSKATWIHDMLSQLPTLFPNVKAFIWFNINKEADWRINSSEDSRQAFAQGLASSYYANNQYSGISTTPIPYLGSLSAAVLATPQPTLSPTRQPTSKPTVTASQTPIPSSGIPADINASPNFSWPVFINSFSKSHWILYGSAAWVILSLGLLFLTKQNIQPKKSKSKRQK